MFCYPTNTPRLQTLEAIGDYFHTARPPSGARLTKLSAWPSLPFSTWTAQSPTVVEAMVSSVSSDVTIFTKDISRWWRLEPTTYDAVDLLIRCCRIQHDLLAQICCNTNATPLQVHES